MLRGGEQMPNRLVRDPSPFPPPQNEALAWDSPMRPVNTMSLFRGVHSPVMHSGSLHCSVELCIEAQQYKVYPGTEQDVYNDSFFSRQDLVVNALDNVEARRYVDR